MARIEGEVIDSDDDNDNNSSSSNNNNKNIIGNDLFFDANDDRDGQRVDDLIALDTQASHPPAHRLKSPFSGGIAHPPVPVPQSAPVTTSASTSTSATVRSPTAIQRPAHRPSPPSLVNGDSDDEPVVVAVRPGRKPVPRVAGVKAEADVPSPGLTSSPLTSLPNQTPRISESPMLHQSRSFPLHPFSSSVGPPASSDLTSLSSRNPPTRVQSPAPRSELWIEPPVLDLGQRAQFCIVSSPVPSPTASSDHVEAYFPPVPSTSGRAQRGAKLQALALQRKLLRKKRRRRDSQDSDASDANSSTSDSDGDIHSSRRHSKRPRRAAKSEYVHDEDDFEEILPPKPKRKSRRFDDDERSAFEIDYDDSDETDDDEIQIDETETEEQEYDRDDFAWGSSKRKRRRSGRNIRPAGSKSSRKKMKKDGNSDDGLEEADLAESRKPVLQKHCPNCFKCGGKAASIAMEKVMRKAARLKIIPVTNSATTSAGADTSVTRRGTTSRTQAGPANYAEVPEEDSPHQIIANEKASLEEKGGWLSCRTCTASYHFDCLPIKRKKDVLAMINKAAQAEYVREVAAAEQAEVQVVGEPRAPFKPFTVLPIDRTLVEEQCAECAEGQNACYVCKETSGQLKAVPEPSSAAAVDIHPPQVVPESSASASASAPVPVDGPDKSVPNGASTANGESTANGDSHGEAKMEEEDELRSEVAEGSPVRIKSELQEQEKAKSGREQERAKSIPTTTASKAPLVLRCQRCHRFVHYHHLTLPSVNSSVEEKARTHQKQDWKCDDCSQWGWVDLILAWRPDSTVTDQERIQRAQTVPLDVDYRNQLPREYLVKFENRPYREAIWVPHSWISIASKMKLKNFLASGSKVELEPPAGVLDGSLGAGAGAAPAGAGAGVGVVAVAAARKAGALDRSRIIEDEARPPLAELDADQRLPKEYLTPERVIDAYFWPKNNRAVRKLGLPSLRDSWGNAKTIKEANAELEGSLLVPARDSEGIVGGREGEKHALGEAAYLLVKWQDLTYEHSTWEAAPLRASDSAYYDALEGMLAAFLHSLHVFVPEHKHKGFPKDPNPKDGKMLLATQPEYIQGGKLLPFQLTGVNWLRSGWYTRCPGILADEMGLGKTIQVISFIGSLIRENQRAPHLVIAPNSTVANWAREFEKWLPGVRVAPIFGESESTAVIYDFELYHDNKVPGRSALRAEVVIMAESIARREGTKMLDGVSYWDTLVVDEGQALKGGEKNLLYRKLNTIEAGHRLLLSGTPLNNNLGELFNLLNWLQPNEKWSNIKALEKKYEKLDATLVTELQDMLRPHFLRRTKEDVLQLPPKTEFIIPVSLRPIQKRLYKDLLEQNLENIQSLVEGAGPSRNQSKAKSSMTNVLMQLRKCIQHPYLISPDLEDVELNNEQQRADAHQRLVDASGKLQLLQRLLRKLKAGGHRVLLFSQFVISLDIVEHFCHGEGHRYLRLDGSTGTKLRQKAIDAYNAPDSPYFVFLLSTRAGGVGINLTSADTVVIMDPDFNPHLDMQAIARAHRIGQKKNTMVFTLVCKNTAEERIIESAKRKRVLDHLIVESMDNTELEPMDLEGILKHGATSLFVEGGVEENEKDIKVQELYHYSDADIDNLIEQGVKAERAAPKQRNELGKFSFAQIWDHSSAEAGDQNQLEAELAAEKDFWADLIRQQQEAALKKRQLAAAKGSGRGVRRGATKYTFDPLPGGGGRDDDDVDSQSDEFGSPPPEGQEDDDHEDEVMGILSPYPSPQKGKAKKETKAAAKRAAALQAAQAAEMTANSLASQSSADYLNLHPTVVPTQAPQVLTQAPQVPTQAPHTAGQTPLTLHNAPMQPGWIVRPNGLGPANQHHQSNPNLTAQRAEATRGEELKQIPTSATLEVEAQSYHMQPHQNSHQAQAPSQNPGVPHTQEQPGPRFEVLNDVRPQSQAPNLNQLQHQQPGQQASQTSLAPSTIPQATTQIPDSNHSAAGSSATQTQNGSVATGANSSSQEQASAATSAARDTSFLTWLQKNQKEQYEQVRMQQRKLEEERLKRQQEEQQQQERIQQQEQLRQEQLRREQLQREQLHQQEHLQQQARLLQQAHIRQEQIRQHQERQRRVQEQQALNQQQQQQPERVQVPSDHLPGQAHTHTQVQAQAQAQTQAQAQAQAHAQAQAQAPTPTQALAQAQAPTQTLAQAQTLAQWQQHLQQLQQLNSQAQLLHSQGLQQPTQPSTSQKAQPTPAFGQTRAFMQQIQQGIKEIEQQMQQDQIPNDQQLPQSQVQSAGPSLSHMQQQIAQHRQHIEEAQHQIQQRNLSRKRSEQQEQQQGVRQQQAALNGQGATTLFGTSIRRRAHPPPPVNVQARSSSGPLPISQPSPSVLQSPSGAASASPAHVGGSLSIHSESPAASTFQTLARWNKIRSELPPSTTAELEERMKNKEVPSPTSMALRPPLTFNQACYYAALFHLPLSIFAESFQIIDRSRLHPDFLRLPHDGAGMLDGLQIKDRVMNVIFCILYSMSAIEVGNGITKGLSGHQLLIGAAPSNPAQLHQRQGSMCSQSSVSSPVTHPAQTQNAASPPQSSSSSAWLPAAQPQNVASPQQSSSSSAELPAFRGLPS